MTEPAPNVVLAHHWLTGMRGGEKVLERLCLMFPGAPIYTLVSKPGKLSPLLNAHRHHVPALLRLPLLRDHHTKLLPLFPELVSSLQVEGRPRLLFSTDAAVIKGLGYGPDIPHVCYCHSPPRYLWDLQETYSRHAAQLGGFGRWVFNNTAPRVREFDWKAAQRVDHFIANSEFVAGRIRQHYGREAEVVYPPVDVDAFDATRPREDFYLIVSGLAPYKRVDLAVEAFNHLGKALVIIGDGSEEASLRARARDNIRFLGRQPFEVLKDHYERCRAMIYPQIEDFGITAVEAQAAGAPVIAFDQGGARETVNGGASPTGLFFSGQTPESLIDAVKRFENAGGSFQAADCRRNAERFRPELFDGRIRAFLQARYPGLV